MGLTWFIRDQCIVLSETLNKAIHGNDHIKEENIDSTETIPETLSESLPNELSEAAVRSLCGGIPTLVRTSRVRHRRLSGGLRRTESARDVCIHAKHGHADDDQL